MPAEHHIRNPFEMALQQFAGAASDASHAVLTRPRVHAAATEPVIRHIDVGDLGDALRKGLADLGATRADVVFICLIYPVAGLLLARMAANYAMLPLVFPLLSGFALIGPLAAIGLYEISRRREEGLPVGATSAFKVLRSPAIGSIVGLGAIVLMLFGLWLAVAYLIYAATLGPEPPASLQAFVRDVFTTGAGWAMIVVGVGVGFLFAVAALAISVISFPLLLDRDTGIGTAVSTSVKAVMANPVAMSVWGLIVAGSLIAGSIPALVGLIFVMPVLGHATWHLYRKVIAD